MEFTEKYTKKYVKGSTVVEMSYLIPFCLILFFLLITIIFYFHDKAILNAAAAETAVTGVEMDRKKIEDADLDAFFRERTSGKLIFLENITIQVDISHILGNLITVIFNYQILRKPLKILSL